MASAFFQPHYRPCHRQSKRPEPFWSQVQAIYAGMLERGLSHTTILHVHRAQADVSLRREMGRHRQEPRRRRNPAKAREEADAHVGCGDDSRVH